MIIKKIILSSDWVAVFDLNKKVLIGWAIWSDASTDHVSGMIVGRNGDVVMADTEKEFKYYEQAKS